MPFAKAAAQATGVPLGAMETIVAPKVSEHPAGRPNLRAVHEATGCCSECPEGKLWMCHGVRNQVSHSNAFPR